jgi:hypothetical protein
MGSSRHSLFPIACSLISVLACSLSGCKTWHVSYSLDDVKPVPGSAFAAQTLFVAKFADSRYKDRKSVSYYVHKTGSYGAHGGRDLTNKSHSTGLRPTPEMNDYREIFRGVPYSPDTSYYWAPDRLYWVPNGPLTETREMLARHLDASRVFRAVTLDEGVQPDYVLKLEAKRFIGLKERRPVLDLIDILWTGYLFSSDEVISARVEWTLERRSDGKVVTSGIANFGDVSRHHSYGARERPFELHSKAAEQIGNQIVRDIARVATKRK